MNERVHDWKIWLIIAVVFCVVFGVVMAVLNHAREKPESPHALVAAMFNQAAIIGERNPGFGTRPLLIPRTAGEKMQWRALYVCPRDGQRGVPAVDANGVPHCPVCGQVMVLNK